MTVPSATDIEFRLDGRWAVVTGAGRGIGAAISLGLATAGADLVLIDRPGSPGLADMARSIGELGVRAHTVEFDLARPASMI